MNSERLVTIYALCDPDTDEVHYIGQTNQKPEKRIRDHMTERMQNPNSRKQLWLDDLKSRGKEPIFSIICTVDEDVADEIEVNEISRAKAAGFDLLNVKMGANGGVSKRRNTRRPRRP